MVHSLAVPHAATVPHLGLLLVVRDESANVLEQVAVSGRHAT